MQHGPQALEQVQHQQDVPGLCAASGALTGKRESRERQALVTRDKVSDLLIKTEILVLALN